MKASQLKKIVKECVRECLNEILAEKFIESKIRESINPEPWPVPTPSHVLSKDYGKVVTEVATDLKPKPKQQNPEVRKLIMEKLGLNEKDPMSFVFEDTAARSNPIVTGAENDPGVSENAMKKAGVFEKDWSKFL